MVLVEKHIIKPSHQYYDELDHLCLLSKNLYNATLYTVRQYYFANKQFLNYQAVNKIYAGSNQNLIIVPYPPKSPRILKC